MNLLIVFLLIRLRVLIPTFVELLKSLF